ncbi:MAG TPA: thrombospondin type 3 repeat-containing protein [bacterium]|nr:thrombospondin type 3 repeat-containing protein [bacterium]
MEQQTKQTDLQTNQESRPNSSLEQNPVEEENPWFKNKKVITVILILIGVFVVAGLSIAGYYYKDKIFGTEDRGQIIQEDRNLILENWEKLVLTQDELNNILVKEGLRSGMSESKAEQTISDIITDFNESNKIESISGFNTLLSTELDNNYEVMGGFVNSFVMELGVGDKQGVLPVLKSAVIKFQKATDAENYFTDTKNWVQNLKQQNPTTLIKELNGVGEECLAFNNLGNKIFLFKTQNYIGLVLDQISANLEAGNIFAYEQANKIQSSLGIPKNNLDSDSDGLSDYDEMYIWNTEPNNSDTDADGYKDGEEIKNGYNPLMNEKTENEDTISEQISQDGDCGTDINCFTGALKNCNKTKFIDQEIKDDQKSDYALITILGERDSNGRCKINIQYLAERLQGTGKDCTIDDDDRIIDMVTKYRQFPTEIYYYCSSSH